MADTMVTYHSLNSPVGKEWLGFIYLEGKHLNVYFTASDEETVKAKMREFYAKDKAARDSARARRDENKRKQAERMKAKAAVVPLEGDDV